MDLENINDCNFSMSNDTAISLTKPLKLTKQEKKALKYEKSQLKLENKKSILKKKRVEKFQLMSTEERFKNFKLFGFYN